MVLHDKVSLNLCEFLSKLISFVARCLLIGLRTILSKTQVKEIGQYFTGTDLAFLCVCVLCAGVFGQSSGR